MPDTRKPGPGGGASAPAAADDPAGRKRAEEALFTAASAVSTDGGDAIFRELTAAIARILAVDVAFIAVFADGTRARVRTLAAVLDGKALRNFEYELAGTPCVHVVGRAFRRVELGARETFPPGTIFHAKGMDSYAAYPLTDSSGEPLGLIVTMSRAPIRDGGLAEALLRIFATRAAAEIERARTEQALRRSEASTRAIFEATEDAVFVHDWDTGRILDVNPKAIATYGWSAEAFRTLPFEALSSGEPPYTAERFAKFVEDARRGPVSFEWHRRHRDGTLHWDDVTLKPAEIEGRPVVLAFARDITSRKAAEQALRASEEQYRAIFDAAVDGLALWDADGRVVDVNPAFLRLFGSGRRELVGSDGGAVFVDEPRGAAHPFLSRVLAGEPQRAEMQALRRDGSTFDVEVRGVAMTYRDRPHALVIVRDLTRQREAAVARATLEARLRRAQKMEAIGHLTGGIAHDFNNLLTTILGYVTLAAEATGDPRLLRYLGEARAASTRARDLVAQMLTFSRGRRGDPRPLSLEAVAGEVFRLARSSLPSTVAISTDFAPDLPPVVADPVQVEQVVLNLCLNARDAMNGRGEIRARIARASVDAQSCASCRAAVSGDFLELSIEDTGPGVPAHVQERMFEPFFTTKEPGYGTGMGLATVHGIVHECGGHVLLESGAEGGARFRVLFPAARRVPALPSSAPGEPAAFPRGVLAGRVVLVDDEPAVAGFMRDLLAEWGLSPRVFHDPAEALAAVAADPSSVDLVIADQSMPGMTGVEVARACSELPDSPPVVIYTGFAENLSQGTLDAAGVTAVVRKPIDPALLHETLGALLRGGSARPAERRARI